MKRFRLCHSINVFTRHAGVLLCLGLILVTAAGCASKNDSKTKPRAGQGIAEYREITVSAQKAVQDTLAALGAVAAQSNQCPPQILSEFSDQVNRLQVDSVQVRARTKALQDRGDDYFQHWHENLARVQDSKVRALAEARRTELEASFRQIKALSEKGRGVFQPFLSSLRQVRNALEKDPAAVQIAATREFIASGTQNGQHLQQHLADILQQLDSMRAMITPSENATLK